MRRLFMSLVAISLAVACSDQPFNDEPLVGPASTSVSSSGGPSYGQPSGPATSGSPTPAAAGTSLADSRMFWDTNKGAFRVGRATGTEWDDANVGTRSVAMGDNTTASGPSSTAMGSRTRATGNDATAMNENTEARGSNSTAMGERTLASGDQSLAAGNDTEARGVNATALGKFTIAHAYSSLVIGRYNLVNGSTDRWNSTDPVFVIGNGSSETNRSNALTVLKNGRIQFGSIEYLEDGGNTQMAVLGSIRPSADNLWDLGTPTFRWDDVYATNGTIITSDIRAKDNVEDTPYGLSEVMRMRPVSFRRKGHSDQSKKLGLVAQDLVQIMPEVVKTFDYRTGEGGELERYELDLYGVNYAQLVPVLIRAIQEQQAMIADLMSTVQQLQATGAGGGS